MSMMMDRTDQPRAGLLQTVIAADALEREKQLDNGLYLERDTLLDDDFLETSIDDYDDLLSEADNGDWNEG